MRLVIVIITAIITAMIFIYKLSSYGIVVLFIDQKFINVSRKKIDIKVDPDFKSKSIENETGEL